MALVRRSRCAEPFPAVQLRFTGNPNPDLHRVADWSAVAAAVGRHLLAPLLAKGIEALAAELQQLVSLAIAQLVVADQAGGAVAVGGDAVSGEHLAHHRLPSSSNRCAEAFGYSISG